MVDYRSPVFVAGMIAEADADTSVRLYERPAGQSVDKLVATLPATLANDGSASFATVLAGLTKTTRLMVIWDGDADHLAKTVTATIKVRPGVSLTAAVQQAAGQSVVRFSVRLAPSQTAGSVALCRLLGGRWVRFATFSARGPIAGTWRPAPGTYKLRASFGGSAANAAASSNVVTVRVR